MLYNIVIKCDYIIALNPAASFYIGYMEVTAMATANIITDAMSIT